MQIPLSCRRGMSLVEVLVVIGIVGLLAALLLPAIQQTRSTARRLTCQNHLRQLGIAITSVAESHGAFPTSQLPESGYWRLLPSLDAAAIMRDLQARRRPESFLVPVLACPSDPVVAINMVVGDASYYFNDGTQFRAHDPTNGFRKSRTKDTTASEITDGLSQTVAMSERLVRPWVGEPPPVEVMDREPRRFLWWTETRFGARGDEPRAIEDCRNHRTTTFPMFFGANVLNYHSSHGYDHLLPPNHAGCYNGPEDFSVDPDLMLMPASSLHSGGVNALMGDGSVHFVNELIDSTVWQALGTRNGQESVAHSFGN